MGSLSASSWAAALAFLSASPWAAVLAFLALIATGARAEPPEVRRVVSLNPSLTAMIVALDARGLLVGVDSFSARQQPEVAELPTVGGLYTPSLEAVVALRPDLVVFVPSAEQRSFHARLGELGLPVLALDPVSFEEVLDAILELGERIGRGEEARRRVAAVRETRRAIAERTAALPRPRAVVVLQRDPLFVAGRGSFVDDMLDTVGAENLGVVFDEPYPRVAREWLLSASPEVILDSARGDEPLLWWKRWPSLPAVRTGRVVDVPEGVVTLPGPYLDRALRFLEGAVHPESGTAVPEPRDVAP
jgi:ABC-type Fe3+-hydroxamate transport system substrate-binding protein